MLAFISLAVAAVSVVLAVVSGTSAPDSDLGAYAAIGGMLLALLAAVLGAVALFRKQGPKWAAITGLLIGALLIILVVAVGVFG